MDGWSSLFDGAASAVIGGVVAALTAWGVVVATRRSDRRLANELAAREAMLKVVQTIVLLLAELREYRRDRKPAWWPNRRIEALVVAHIQLASDLYRAVPLVAALDVRLGMEIVDLGGRIGALLPDHSRKCTRDDLRRADELATELQGLIGEWLTGGKLDRERHYRADRSR
jgi:hypothetical protein